MSDFDKIFAEKLDEEGRFPRKAKNWRTLSSRLDAFESGLHGSSRRLRIWQAAAAVTLVAASVLFGQVISMRHENAGLREQVAELQKIQPRQETTEIAGSNETKTPQTGLATGAKETGQNNTSEKDSFSNNPGQASGHSGVPNTLHGQHGQYAPAGQKGALQTGNDSRQQIAYDKLNTPEQIAGQSATEPSGIAIQDKNPSGGSPDSLQIPDVIPAMAPARLLAVELLPVKSRLAPEKIHMPLVSVPQPTIKPVRQQTSHFRAGIQAVAAIPQTERKGISTPIGSGISAEYAILPNLSIAASADWLHYEINTDSILPRFNLPDHPSSPGNPHHDLVGLEGYQRIQQYSLGLNYTVPVRFWAQPTLRIAHTWARMSPSSFILAFEEHPHGGGMHSREYVPVKSDAKWFNNIWRLGLGLKHETPRWVFGISADYAKGPGSDDSIFDAVVLKAGVQYKFD